MEPTSKQLLDQLTKAWRSNADAVPAGFKTRRQWQAEWKCSSSHAKNLLNTGLQNGLIEQRRFRVASGDGVCSIPHYRPTSSGKKPKAK